MSLAICALAGLQLGVNLIWLQHDSWDVERIPDGFVHAGSVLHLSSGLEHSGVGASAGCLRDIHSFYPVLAHLPRALAGAVVDFSPLVFRAANVIYLVLLLVGVYLLGRLCQGRQAGLLAAALVALMPAVYGGSRVVGLDFPALCVVPLALYVLLRSDGFSRPWYALAFGALAGLAALIKGQSLLFLCWPAALVLGRGLWRQRGARGRVLAGGALTLAALAAVSAVWWVGRLGQLGRVLAGHATGAEMLFYESDPSLWGGVVYFVRTFPLLVSGPLALSLLAALVLFFRHGGRFRAEILLWLLVPLLLHMVLKVRHFRYLFPLVPAAAVILGVAVYSLRSRWRHLLAALLVGSAASLWLLCSFAHGPRSGEPPTLSCVPQRQLQQRPGGALLACGGCSYSGPAARAAAHPLNPVARDLARWLQERHPGGSGLLLQFDAWRHPRTVTLVILLGRLLPEARPFMTGGVRTERLAPATAPPGRQRYQLMLTADTVKNALEVHKVRLPDGDPPEVRLWKVLE